MNQTTKINQWSTNSGNAMPLICSPLFFRSSLLCSQHIFNCRAHCAPHAVVRTLMHIPCSLRISRLFGHLTCLEIFNRTIVYRCLITCCFTIIVHTQDANLRCHASVWSISVLVWYKQLDNSACIVSLCKYR